MNKILLKNDDQAQSEFLRLSWEKLSILNKAVTEYQSQFNEILEMQLFEKNFYDYAITEIRKANPGASVLNLSDEKIAELYNHDVNGLKQLTDLYNSKDTKLKFDKGLFDVDDKVDFGIYATTKEEIERYNDAKALIDALNTLRVKSDSRNALNGEIIYQWIETDPSGEFYIPATYYVKQ